MSELRDTLEFFEAVDRRLDEQDKINAEQVEINARDDAKFREIEKRLAIVDRAQQSFESQIEIFREGLKQSFDNLRRELRGK